MASTDLYDLGTDLLNAVVTRMTTDGITLPSRQYVTAGEVAIDCEQVVVSWESLFQGLPGVQDTSALRCYVLRSAQVAIWISRCVPAPKDGPPSAAELDASGATILTDATALMKAVVNAYHAQDFSGSCDSMSILSVSPYGPDGQYGGVVMRIQVQL